MIVPIYPAATARRDPVSDDERPVLRALSLNSLQSTFEFEIVYTSKK
jgi:hypothetical protein